MGIPKVDLHTARTYDFYRMNLRGGLLSFLRGLDYVRCIEFPLVYNSLLFPENGRYLDVGCGKSIFPLFVASLNKVRVTAMDQGPYVNWQLQMFQKLSSQGLMSTTSYKVMRNDIRSLPFQDSSFDEITAISTLEHIENHGDTVAIQELSRVLAENGRLVISVPFNYRCYRDCHVNSDVYSRSYVGKPLFFQRHYDDDTIESRLIKPSGLKVIDRKNFGEPGFPFFNIFFNPKIPVQFKVPYLWLAPVFAKRFLRVLKPDEVKTKRNMPVVTPEGALIVLTK